MERERLLQERLPLRDPFLENDVVRMPGHEHDLQAGPQLNGAFGEFATGIGKKPEGIISPTCDTNRNPRPSFTPFTGRFSPSAY